MFINVDKQLFLLEKKHRVIKSFRLEHQKVLTFVSHFYSRMSKTHKKVLKSEIFIKNLKHFFWFPKMLTNF